MIARLSGEIAEKGQGYVVVFAGGVGYQVYITERCQTSLPDIGMPVDLFTKQIVRENEITLYGFQRPSEKRLFELLLLVNGMGPKLALALLGNVGEEGIISAILHDEWKALTRAPGLGTKLAERIKLELADKIREESLLGKIGKPRTPVFDDVVEALVALGHKRSEAERAASEARKETKETDTKIVLPIALRHAANKKGNL